MDALTTTSLTAKPLNGSGSLSAPDTSPMAKLTSEISDSSSLPTSLDRATVHCGDAFDFIASVKDDKGRGLYVDAPWPEKGDCYRHTFIEAQQRQLAKALSCYKESRIVIRFGDHPLIRELYPESHWLWVMQAGRAQSNEGINEVLLINGKSYGKGALCN